MGAAGSIAAVRENEQVIKQVMDAYLTMGPLPPMAKVSITVPANTPGFVIRLDKLPTQGVQVRITTE